jgi:hypothetical protein
MWGELKRISDYTFLISSDTRKKDELNDALDKFAQIYLDTRKDKKKIVAFKVRDEDDDIPRPPR